MNHLRLVINTAVSKSRAYDAVNGTLTQEIPTLKKFASQLSRSVSAWYSGDTSHAPEEKNISPARGRMRPQSYDGEEDSVGFSVKANILFRARGEKHSDIIVELISSSRLQGVQSGAEVRILRSLLWRIGRMVINGLTD